MRPRGFALLRCAPPAELVAQITKGIPHHGQLRIDLEQSSGARIRQGAKRNADDGKNHQRECHGLFSHRLPRSPIGAAPAHSGAAPGANQHPALAIAAESVIISQFIHAHCAAQYTASPPVSVAAITHAAFLIALRA